MPGRIQQGFVIFLGEGEEGVAAVRHMRGDHLVAYVENAGEFKIPMAAVKAVHDEKVVLDRSKVGADFLAAVSHAHDREDPRELG